MPRSSQGIGSANSASTDTFVTALVFNLIVFLAELAAFTLIRPHFPAIYQPRTYIPTEGIQAKSLTDRWFAWPLAVFRADYELVKEHNGMDAYFFVRFLRMTVKILLPIWILSWIVLMPVTSVNTGVAGHSGLDIFVFGNISNTDQARYAAHIIMAWLFTFWIWWNLRAEMQHFVVTRQRWLIDPRNAKSAQASTVLITGIPQRYLTEAALTDLFSVLPGGVRKVWLNRDLKDMPKLYERRLKACNKLESAETALLRKAVKLHNKHIKADEKAAKKEAKKGKRQSTDDRPLTDTSTIDTERNDIDTFVPRKKRPSHRLPPFSFLPFSLPLIGKKLDSIEWARSEIADTSSALDERRNTLVNDVSKSSSMAPAPSSKPDALKPMSEDQTYPPSNAAFILFNNQLAAHLAAQALTHHMPYRMSAHYMNVAPADVIWGNLGMNPYESRVRAAISWAATAALIIFWAIPVAFVGAVSNIHALCDTASWLAWICNLPGVVVGIISGILPPALLAVLMLLLPIVLRMLSRFEGTPTKTAIELSLMTRYFLFQVIHSFLIVTLASGIVAALPGLINNVGSIPTLLAQELPSASNFFLTYIVLQGLSGTASGFLQASPLVMYYLKLFILGSTPRSVYKVKYGTRSVSFGTLFPSTTLLVVITITYSVISPIINGLAFVTFLLFYFLWKYLFLWQLDQPRSGDSGGLFYPRALQHVFVGLYLQQICLAALFFLARDENGKPSALPEGVLMIILIVLTAFFHLTLNNSYWPLISAIPLSLADQTQAPAIPRAQDAKRPGETYTDDGAVGGPDEDPSTYEDFAHPAAVESQRVVWIPRDKLGLFAMEEREDRAHGIEVSDQGARMDAKGHVDIEGPPPGENVRV
ncbi:uncharacterized protein PHACADRAFT_169556 [Phanerochaete carnosa HHB-10118-sp]|uniref:DUF221-domain-containing protein n=1 Tax=Phanerochaete carnosa (strain HHB-10118-sp) TaxID=650164 RepID=K5WI99_PHACS|nr:uncharacterized protein PHACADRAFT_169556 [Phanerochaete carnosa HHB-10118-sp]EKM59100.1 hypothetical protein PHACADRAFT_169556 [Phanerochaete carnosa HHB-10118-sp]